MVTKAFPSPTVLTAPDVQCATALPNWSVAWSVLVRQTTGDETSSGRILSTSRLNAEFDTISSWETINFNQSTNKSNHCQNQPKPVKLSQLSCHWSVNIHSFTHSFIQTIYIAPFKMPTQMYLLIWACGQLDHGSDGHWTTNWLIIHRRTNWRLPRIVADVPCPLGPSPFPHSFLGLIWHGGWTAR